MERYSCNSLRNKLVGSICSESAKLLALSTSLEARYAQVLNSHLEGKVIKFLALVCLWRKSLAYLSSGLSY